MKYELSDAGNLERFIDKYGDRVRFCPEANTWLERTDAAQWRHTFREFGLKFDVTHDLDSESRQDPDNEALKRWARRSGMNYALHAIICGAKRDPLLHISLEDFKRLDIDYKLIEWRVNARLKRMAKKQEARSKKQAPR